MRTRLRRRLGPPSGGLRRSSDLRRLAAAVVAAALACGPVLAEPAGEGPAAASGSMATGAAGTAPKAPEIEGIPGPTGEPRRGLPAGAFRAEFVEVLEAADTIVVETPDKGREIVVRLAGIRAPRVHEPFWARCAREITTFLTGRTLLVALAAEPGAAGAPVPGRIYVDGGKVDVAASLVRSGCAAVTAPGDDWLLRCEEDARAERRCIWVDPDRR